MLAVKWRAVIIAAQKSRETKEEIWVDEENTEFRR